MLCFTVTSQRIGFFQDHSNLPYNTNARFITIFCNFPCALCRSLRIFDFILCVFCANRRFISIVFLSFSFLFCFYSLFHEFLLHAECCIANHRVQFDFVMIAADGADAAAAATAAAVAIIIIAQPLTVTWMSMDLNAIVALIMQPTMVLCPITTKCSQNGAWNGKR